MSEITGIVESLGTKEVKTRFGMKPTFSMKVDGEWYKLGFTKPKCDKGDEVSFSYVEGTYGREVDAKAISVGSGAKSAPTPGAAAPRAAPSYGGKGVFPIPALDGQRAIVRQNALTNARELVVGCAGGKAFDADEEVVRIIAIARKFEAYACGDLDARRAEEMKDALAKRGPTAEEVME